MQITPEITTTLKILNQKLSSNTMLGRMSTKYDPFKVLISTILSARARDEVTEIIADELFKKYPSAQTLAAADKKYVITIIRKIGFFNAKAHNIIETAKILMHKYNGTVPQTLPELLELPGVGRKVANCVLVYAFNQSAIPVDTHVHRISNRMGWIQTKTPEETEQKLMKLVPKKYWQIVNDTLVTHGKTICAPISPNCSKCPVYDHCKRVGVKYHR